MRIAILPGDGIGPETVTEARKVVDALGLSIEWTEFGWGSSWWQEHGEMMPSDGPSRLRDFDAVLHGAGGMAEVLSDADAAWGLGLRIRQELDLWANVRPVRLLEGIPCPLAGRGPEDIDMVFVRENTEGEYSGAGGRVHSADRELAIEVSVFTRFACERVIRHAYELAAGRRGLLVSATKSNALRHAFQFWDGIVDEVGAEFPAVRTERVLVDALCARLISRPHSIDVVVGSNLFGDILTDLAGALQGGIGMSPSANIAPGSKVPGMFEPIHGSAPDIAGRSIANPSAAIWSAALMLQHLGYDEAAHLVIAALEFICRAGPRTADVGGTASTVQVGDAVAERVRALVG
jgi:tartrate dehydrogenase/decarboxylase / D-malate dehydrogenase